MKNTFNKVALIITLFAIIFLYGEFEYKKSFYFKDNIYNLELQYNDKVRSYKSMADFWASKIVQLPSLTDILKQVANGSLNVNDAQVRINHLLLPIHVQMQAQGIKHLVVNFKDGRQFICSFNDKAPHSVIPTGKKTHTYKTELTGYEAGRLFEGLRYFYPLFHKDEYIGSFEVGIDEEDLLNLMDKNLDAQYSIAIRRNHLVKEETIVTPDTFYYESFFDRMYVIHNKAYNTSIFNSEKFTPFKNQINHQLDNENSFALYHLNGLYTSSVYVFVAIYDLQKRHVGYIISKREDNYINKLYTEQFLKFLSFLFILYIVRMYYQKQIRSKILLEQYKTVVDQTNILSKTDTEGRITYVNKVFESISGYSKKELIGKKHNIIRHPDMPVTVFKELWETISRGEIWKGKFKNRKKDGSSYIVEATIFPLTDESGNIVEYIAIRHDITKLEALKELLEKKLQENGHSLEEKMYLLTQYERAIEQSALYARTDTQGVITYLNKMHEVITGFKNEELIGNTHSPLRDPATPNSFYQELWSTIQQKQIWKGIIKNKNKTGDFFFLDTTIIPILDKSDVILEYMSIQYDVTELLLLQEDIVETQREVIYMMGEITETRSKETGNHVKRVAEYARLLAIKSCMDEEEANILYAASPMHDIGKIGIPDDILNKPGKLTANEWAIMTTHTDIGHNILKSSERTIMKAAAIVAYEHHEKWDGTGYPRGIKGEEIHIYGRIVAIADVFDALGSDRIYKKAWELEKILELFHQESGRHFDPVLVEIFFNNLPEFLLIRDRLKD
ncbi:HD domain-containing phosphohydrolase [Sulfuricurvum sp.]|uniref:HD domain-containing phosphohydrolase n=1 Tax=Sulfuricurvum sp. TaxID=2025608 RepID=UPI0035644F73